MMGSMKLSMLVASEGDFVKKVTYDLRYHAQGLERWCSPVGRWHVQAWISIGTEWYQEPLAINTLAKVVMVVIGHKAIGES